MVTKAAEKPVRALRPLAVEARPYPKAFEPSDVRYIKLGAGGTWFDAGIADGHIRFHDLVPHEVALTGDWEAAHQIYLDNGETTAKDRVRELRAFYEPDDRRLWITFGAGRLWWGVAEDEVTQDDNHERIRRIRGGWSCLDAHGDELVSTELSSALTRVHGYRKTICSVAAEAYLMRRLRAEPDPLVVQTQALMTDLHGAVTQLIGDLDWRDFEVMVDLIFANSGWRRITAIGGSDQADTDMVVEQALTGERAFVQVKSRADAAALQDYVERFQAYPQVDRFIFACHSPRGALAAPESLPVSIWLRPELADHVMRAGLVGWLLEKRR